MIDHLKLGMLFESKYDFKCFASMSNTPVPLAAPLVVTIEKGDLLVLIDIEGYEHYRFLAPDGSTVTMYGTYNLKKVEK